MKRLKQGLAVVTVAAMSLAACSGDQNTADPAAGDDPKTLGIVALIAEDALNVAVIDGATEAAEEAGWDVRVTDTQASADQANAAMTTFVTQDVDAIFVLAFASSALGEGLAAARAADVPVATWGGEIVDGIVVTTSGQTVGVDSVNALLDEVGDEADVLALTFHPGKLCLDRGIAFDDGVEGASDLNITYNEVTVPGQVEDGASFTSAWLAGNPAGDRTLAIWACWDEPMQGAISTLRQANRTDVVTVSINGSPQALQAVQDGHLTATVWQPAFDEGKAVFQAVLDSIEAGDSWEPETIEIPGVVVDADTIDDFLADHPDALN